MPLPLKAKLPLSIRRPLKKLAIRGYTQSVADKSASTLCGPCHLALELSLLSVTTCLFRSWTRPPNENFWG